MVPYILKAGAELLNVLLSSAIVIDVNTLPTKVGWISWLQGECCQMNKVKQCNLECEPEQMALLRVG